MLRTNIPTVRTSFIGRTREVAEVTQRLASSRLVTLTGAAGCGKSRLALRVAREVSDRFAGSALVTAVLDELGIERAHFIGTSYGDRLGFGIGEHAPERVWSGLITLLAGKRHSNGYQNRS